MASIINAATSGGLVTTADTSGILQLQTAGTTAVTVDASQRVGIGTTGPAKPLNVASSATTEVWIESTSTQKAILSLSAGDTSVGITSTYNSGGSAPRPFIFYNVSTPLLQFDLGKSIALQGASTATGTGITFPATQSASTDANTLDDYEEGSFTFTVTGLTVALTNTAYYTKIGNQVTVSIPNLAGTSNSTLCTITGFPVAIRSNADYVSFLLVYNASVGYNGHIYGGTSNTINVYWDAGESAFTPTGVKGIINIANFTYTIY